MARPDRYFTVMLGWDLEKQIAAVRAARVCRLVIGIPWAMIEPHEPQALRNHSQTLKRLDERGGLSACEALAVLEDRAWRRMDAGAAHERLADLLLAFETENAVSAATP